MRILLVEDSDDFCELLHLRMKKRFKAEFIIARCGRQASEMLDVHEIDLVVSDFHMPSGNGLWLYRYMRRHFPLIPLIMFTSAPYEINIETNQILRAVVEKPDFKSLFNHIEEAIEFI